LNRLMRRLLACITATLALSALADPAATTAIAPGTRTLMDAHNCYPYFEWWADRIHRVLLTGTPLAIEQDLAWYTDPDTHRSWSIVTHGAPLSRNAPTLDSYFFKAVAPIVEAALRKGDRSQWPLITLNLDLKSEEPEHLAAIWQSLESHRTWLTSAPRTADGSEAPLTVRPILVLTGSSDPQQKVFYDDRPVGSDLLVFGSVHTFEQNAQATPSVLEPEAATDYRRWWNNPWDVVEAGGQTKAGLWTPADASRLKALVEHAHNHGLWIRFYTLDGVGSGSAEKDLEPTSEASKTLSSFGWFRGYNFGSPAAVEQRWRAAAGAGVDYIASDQYEQLAALLRTLSRRVQP
jgi:hypothetical protein